MDFFTTEFILKSSFIYIGLLNLDIWEYPLYIQTIWLNIHPRLLCYILVP